MADLLDLLASNSTYLPSAQPRMAIVTSSNPEIGAAKVMLQPEGTLTGWLPVLTQWVGSGWGISCPPSPGDQVLVLPQEGDAQHGVIVGRVFSSAVRPPDVNIGEIAIVHRSGCSIKLLNSGVISMQGDLHVTGDVYDSHGSLSRLRDDYDGHVHSTMSGQNTSVPLTTD